MSITKETNYTLSVVAIVTLPSKTEPNIPIYNLQSEREGPTWNGHSSHVVVTPINRLCGVDSSWLRQKLGISVFVEPAPVAKPLSWQQP